EANISIVGRRGGEEPAQGQDRAGFEHALLAEHGIVGEAAVGNVLGDAHDARDGTLLVANADPAIVDPANGAVRPDDAVLDGVFDAGIAADPAGIELRRVGTVVGVNAFLPGIGAGVKLFVRAA